MTECTERSEGMPKGGAAVTERTERGEGVMEVVHSRAGLASARARLTGTVAVVMTMGALHEGHRALIRAARAHADHVLVTIFVNPLQFGPNEDFDRYPRTLDADLDTCRAERVDLVFAPDRDEMYPGGSPLVRVAAGPLGEMLEGASRPGHFDGVLTVVCKLLLLTRPDLAFFGEKDYQQLALIRNRYLSVEQHETALALSRALREGAAQTDAESALSVATKILSDGTGIAVDYLALTDPALGPAPLDGPARLLVAARVGSTRLIDNVPPVLGGAS